MTEPVFYNIYDKKTIQKLIDSLSAALNIGISIYNPLGDCLIDSSTFAQEACVLTPCACQEHSPFVRHCKSTGLVDAVIYLMVDKIHVANMLVGKVCLAEEQLSDEEYCRIARENRVNETEYLAQIHRLPVMTKAHFRIVLDALCQVADALSFMGYQGLTLKELSDSLENKELLHQKERNILTQLAEVDSLTGLYNRHKFDRVMEQYKNTKSPLCLISADVNYLKLSNDIFGHKNGDILLSTCANILVSIASPDWIVARCGGDEFRLLLPDCTLDTAEDYCRRVQQNCMNNRNLPLPVSMSLGVAQWDPQTESLEECFARADELMYQNKSAIKLKHHLPDYIMNHLFDRLILSREALNYAVKLSYEFALYLDLPKTQAEKISLAMKYEDIGMIKIPERLMLYGHKKSEEERQLLRAHVLHSNMITRQFEDLYTIADFILYAHENWDGNSYPKKLAGTQIPLESRIIRLINNYACRVIPNVVTKTYTKSEAIEMLLRERGKAYDPYLVDKFLEFID